MTRPGFTMLEIAIVAAITIIVATLGIPALRTGQKNTELTANGRSLLNTLRLAQELAIGQQIKHVVKIINGTSSKYQLIKRDTTDTIIKEYNLNSGVSWGAISGLTNSNEVEFNNTGAVTNYGSITLQNQNSKTFVLTIKTSGYVQIQ